jgi:hypothetical protein
LGFSKKCLAFCFLADYSFLEICQLKNATPTCFAEEQLMLSSDFRKLVAVALVLTTVLVTMPVSAADFSTPKTVIGSVSAVGPVELRGVGISQEGTLFAGDSIRSGQKGYAKVLLGTGSKIELAEKTDVRVNRDAEGLKIAMNTGTVGFTARTPLRVDILPFEVIASDDSAGNVAVMTSGAAGVRAISGKVTVRNLKTRESFVLTKGQERLLSLKDGMHAPPLAQIASNVPGPIPAPQPQAPAPKPAGRTGGLAMDTGAWLAVIGGAAVTGVAIWGLVTALDNRDDIKDLRTNVNTLNSTIAANAASSAAALRNVSNAAAIAATAAQQQALLASIQGLAGQAQLALTVAGNAAGAAQAAAISNLAANLQSQLSSLQAGIQALQAQAASGANVSSQLSQSLTLEEQLRATTNSLAGQLNALLAANRNVTGVPGATVGTIPPPNVASASVPV